MRDDTAGADLVNNSKRGGAEWLKKIHVDEC